jgi:hypothetical protein
VLIKGTDRKVLIASDTIPLFENWSGTSPVPSGVFNSLDVYYSTFDKMRELHADLVLPGHDAKVFTHAEYLA